MSARDTISLKVENFGPVKKGEVLLGGVTLFYGKPNTGKSYTAKLLYALLKAPQRGIMVVRETRRVLDAVGIHVPSVGEIMKKEGGVLLEARVNLSDVEELLTNVYNRGLRSLVAELYPGSWHRLLEKSRIHLRGRRASISVEDGRARLDIEKDVRIDLRIEVYAGGSSIEIIYACAGLRCEFHFLPLGSGNKSILESRVAREVLRMLAFSFADYALGYRTATYIPYGRSVIALLAAGVRSEPLPKLTRRALILHGMLKEPFRSYLELFETSLLRSQGRSLTKLLGEKIGRAAEHLAGILLEGDMVAEEDETGWRLFYNSRGVAVELGSASAMAAEAAGLLYPLAYITSKYRQSFIIIEEPESQLHPSAQRIIYWLLLAAAARGVDTLITTHSDYLLTEAAISAVLRKLDREERTEVLKVLLGGEQDSPAVKELEVRLDHVPVRAYLFSEGEVVETSPEELIEKIPTITDQVLLQLDAIRKLYEKPHKK